MKIQLTQLHEHAGVRYAPGAVLDLPDATAGWLVELGRAVYVVSIAPVVTPSPPRAKRVSLKGK